ncbi:glycerophosphodiester phosphodiesterase [Crocinitomix algicola]|uniref:glycerophosphodiester phosphodiesterase n=1 Tax=Crocinitomix algicola TaxID=1740263 RepID=UPI000829FEA6|nr:glycerophosphodiester phosphodiesterase family protein [Crocinitomix algicola]
MNWHSVLFIILVLLSSGINSCHKEEVYTIPVIYGHAGISLSPEREVFPRNTKPSILYALDVLNADGVEVDVQMTKDSVLVIYHEDFLEESTNGSGCVSETDFEEIESLAYFKKYKILKLEEVLKWTNTRDKKLCLDLKHFNACKENYVDFEAFNLAFNKALSKIQNLNKANVSINSRAINLLTIIEDTEVNRIFENDDVKLGLTYFNDGLIDKVAIKLAALNENNSKVLRQSGIDFMVFGIKTKAEIRKVSVFNPTDIISDNIAATRKFYY